MYGNFTTRDLNRIHVGVTVVDLAVVVQDGRMLDDGHGLKFIDQEGTPFACCYDMVKCIIKTDGTIIWENSGPAPE